MYKKNFAGLLLAGTLAALPAFSQEEAPQYRSEATVQALGSFVKSTNENGIRQGATNSGGVLGSYRFLFNRHNGVDFSYGYMQNTQNYAFPTGSSAVSAYSHEATAAYVVRMPLKHFAPFALAGAGALVFDPKNAPIATTQTKPAFVYGAGADFNLTKRLYLRAQYRGLVYNSPNFDIPALNVDRLTHRAEPSAGFGFRF